MALLAEILEVLMIVSFGASWPFNVIKSYKARTTKGKSLTFLCLIFFGYIAGVVMKAIKISIATNLVGIAAFISWLGLSVYILNLLMVGTDLALYFRNKNLDKLAAKNEEVAE
jgi:hypothetical protein